MVAAAVVGTLVSVAGTVYSANKAAQATKDATNASINAQQTAQQRQEALNAPYAAIGTGTTGANGQPTGGAIQQYQNLLGLGPQGSAGIQATLAQTPGYEFAKQQGLGATTNAATASGMALSGNTLEALDRYSTGLADSTYQQAVGNAQNAVTIGQNAAAGTGAGILQTGANIGNALINQGNTLAGISTNEAAGISKAIGSGVSQYATLGTLQGLNSPNTGVTYTPDIGSVNAGLTATDAAGNLIPVGP
jgi:hypothetical protein